MFSNKSSAMNFDPTEDADNIFCVVIRVPIVFILFLSLWSLSLVGIENIHIRSSHVFANKLNPDVVPGTPFQVALYSGILFLCLVSSVYVSSSLPENKGYGVWTFCMLVLVLSLLPSAHTYRAQFWYLLKTTERIFSPKGQVFFIEVFVADALTSLAKTLSDIGLIIWFWTLYDDRLMPTASSHIINPNVSKCLLQGCMATLPFLLRARQCKVCYDNEENLTRKKNHLMNFIKYISSFPVVWIPVTQSIFQLQSTSFFNFIKYSALILNSGYSLLWDIKMDWGLFGKSPRWPGTRKITLMNCAWPYYAAVLVDVFLRFSWLLKLMESCDTCSFMDSKLAFEIIEICRRAMWFVLRVEWEFISINDEKNLQPMLQLNSEGNTKPLVHVI
mmetsp:Transcript_28942/g.36313  ORF Transcript_28942/g.36313 Transcript_28942/m.36313 type:complete len:388 (-) Transcript_28942:148-1311(-)